MDKWDKKNKHWKSRQEEGKTDTRTACVHILTFFVKMFCIANVKVANKALSSPTRSKDNSVAVAIITPPTTGINEQ